MQTTTLNTLKAAALLALIAVAAGVCLVLLQFSSAIKHTDDALNGTDGVLVGMTSMLAGVDQAAAKTGATLDSISRLCPGPKDPIRPCGMLADIDRTLATIRSTAGQVEIAAIHENAQLSTIDLQERTLFADIHQTLGAASGTAAAATAVIGTANTSISAAKPLLDASTLAVSHADAATLRVNAFLNSPELVDDGVQVHELLAHGNAIAGDAQFEADKFAHPAPQRWYQKTWTVARETAQLLYDFIR